MAVYTEVTAEDLYALLERYDSGSLTAFKGIAEGVENSNFFLGTDDGQFILTLYERRVSAGDLPFFLGLMEHLAARGITCPQPVKNRQGGVLGKLAGRPASLPSTPPWRFFTGCGQVMPRVARCSIRPKKNGRSFAATRFSYSVRMKLPALVCSRKLEFSTPSAMPL